MSWIVRMSHFDYKDDEAYKFEKSALKLWKYFGDIVYQTLTHVSSYNQITGLKCRRRPNKIPCSGLIKSELSPDKSELNWWCPICSDNGNISDWAGTRWDPERKAKGSFLYSDLLKTPASDAKNKFEDTKKKDERIIHENIKGKISHAGILHYKNEEEEYKEYDLPSIVVNGQELNWLNLGENILTYEGFKIKIIIYE